MPDTSTGEKGPTPVPPMKRYGGDKGPALTDEAGRVLYIDSKGNIFALPNPPSPAGAVYTGESIPTGGLSLPDVGGAVSDTIGNAVGGILPKFTGDLRHFVLRSVEVVLGVSLIMIGVVVLGKDDILPGAIGKIAKGIAK